jgi:hypothetical protein
MLFGGIIVGLVSIVRQYKLTRQNAALLKQLQQHKEAINSELLPENNANHLG